MASSTWAIASMTGGGTELSDASVGGEWTSGANEGLRRKIRGTYSAIHS
jgi:hypothetical protein